MMLATTTSSNNAPPLTTTSKSSISSLLSSTSPSESPPPSPANMKTTSHLLSLPASFTANSLSTALNAATTTSGHHHHNSTNSFADDPTTALLMLKESLQKHSPVFSKLPTSKSDSVLSTTEIIDLSSRSSYHSGSKLGGTNSTSASPSPRSSPSPAVFTSISSASRSISPSHNTAATTITLNVPKRLLFESAGTYGLQRNVPFLLRNSTIWRPGALPTPTNVNPATGTVFSQFEYVRLNFPNSMCSVEEVTKRNRNTRTPHPASTRATMGSPSSPAMMRPGAHASVIDLKVECKVFVVKDGVREKDPVNEVKDVFVVREHPQKMVRRGEELQISVRFHKLPSDFISSSREFIFAIRMYRMNTSGGSSPLSISSKLHAQDEEFLFDSDIILHSKSRTKPGQSAKEAAAEREANRIMTQQQTPAVSSDPNRSPMTNSMHNLSISSPKVGTSNKNSSNWRSTSLSPDSSSPSPNTSPSRIVIPSPTKPSHASPTFDAASLVYNLQRSSSGSPGARYSSMNTTNTSAPLLGDLCEEADRVSKRARISSLLNSSSDSLPSNSVVVSDTRTDQDIEESRKHWVRFLQQVGLEQPEKTASILVKEKIEISQLASLRFEVLRALGFLVGDILRMIDHSATYLKENPTLNNINNGSATSTVSQISNQISTIHLNRSNSGINSLLSNAASSSSSSSGLPNSISPSPCASPRTSYETNDGSNKHRGQVSRNAKDEIEDGDEDSSDLQIDDEESGIASKDDSMTSAAKVSNEDRKDKESITSEYSGDEAEEVENEKKRRRPSAFHLHPSRDQMEIFDVQEALIKLSNSPPPNRFMPIRTQSAIARSSLGRSALTSSSSALPSVTSTTASAMTSNPTQATNSSSSPPNVTSSLPSSKVSTQLRETIKLVQRFADKMVSKISNINNLDQELAERSKEMANVVSHLEACLALSSPPAKPYTLEEIDAVSQRISNNSNKGLNCSSDSVDSPRLSSVALRSSANQIHNNSSCSDNESTDGDYDLEDIDSDTENLDAFQPLAYYVGVIKAHLELRKPDPSRKSAGLKRDVLKKEYVLVPIEEASRVLGISTTKLSRAYKSTSILSRCGWVFKGRKRRLRWPTRPLRVLLKYICEKYLCEMANSYVSLEADKQQQQRLPRSHSLDHLLI